ncbi:MAG: PAS domain S-box protein [Gammaproteobacteria bacterium]|nr:PAS domain S-box protein [Gammaproteobacteria bacterium]
MRMVNTDSSKQRRILNTGKLSLMLVILSVLLAAGYLVFNSYSDARKVHGTTTKVLRDQQLKRVLLASMFSASRVRSVILLEMAAEEDVFELDDLSQRFAEQARIFITAREKIYSQPLTEKEFMLLERVRKTVAVNAPKQNKVAELFTEEKREQAISLLFSHAIPGQNKVLEQLSLIIDEYNKNSVEFIKIMDREFETNTHVYILLGGLLLVIGTIAIVIMLTRVSRKEEQQLSQALDELAEQKFALDQHAIVAITDVEGTITYANDRFCKLSGYSEDELIGQNHRLLNSGEKDNAEWQEMYRVLNSGQVWHDVVRNKAKDGHFYWVDTTIVPFMGKDNTPRSYIAIRTDITERIQSEQALRRSQKMDALGQLTGGIAHDFNNILNIILGNLELLKKQIPDDEKTRQRVQNIHKSTMRAAELTRQLLSFSRHQAENVTITNLNQLIEEMGNLIAHSVTPQVEIEWHLARELWTTEIAPGDFEDSLLNLVINARDALSGSGWLSIETANTTLDDKYCENNPDIEPGDYVQLKVSDCGEGMTAEQLEHIFEPFYTTKEQGKGTGLGLAMVFGFIQRSKGHINVESEQGIGTTFRFYLPRSNEVMQIADASTKESKSMLPEGNETILVVDDEEALLDLAEESLLDLGYRVLTAGNGQQALDVLTREVNIDLMISDVIMPGGINGYELAERVTADHPELKVLLASGYTEKITSSENHKRFSANLLAKPYSQVELAQKVRQIFAKPNGNYSA